MFDRSRIISLGIRITAFVGLIAIELRLLRFARDAEINAALVQNFHILFQVQLVLTVARVLHWVNEYLWRRIIVDEDSINPNISWCSFWKWKNRALWKYFVLAYLLLGEGCMIAAKVVSGRETKLLTVISFISFGTSAVLLTFIGLTDIAFWIKNDLIPKKPLSKKKQEKERRSEYFAPWKQRRVIPLLLTVWIVTTSVYNAYQDPILKRIEVVLDRLPKSLDQMTIVQLSDIHIGPTVGRSSIERIVQTVNDLKADVVVITGDLVDGVVEGYLPCVEPLAHISSRHGVYFVTGNHEYISGHVDEWADELAKINIKPLRNSRVLIGTESEGLDLVGIEDWTANQFTHHKPDIAKAMEGRNVSRESILLAHQPKHIFEAAEHDVGLQLSGHTHGGQFFPAHLFVYLGNPYFAGHHHHPNSRTQIYVSRGTKYWGPPMRFWSQHEITHITLRAGKSKIFN
eukprot:TRINITY_DN6533_c0_g1_i4.p1 TRINITY_DN6533_c0_g1~~TRINITY_DN6533_c0_g1_i4.p1  ORF type:complete len:458 (+),score=84.71 TRINITY_DN6533_c0_g1_i4:39-1412(+)